MHVHASNCFRVTHWISGFDFECFLSDALFAYFFPLRDYLCIKLALVFYFYRIFRLINGARGFFFVFFFFCIHVSKSLFHLDVIRTRNSIIWDTQIHLEYTTEIQWLQGRFGFSFMNIMQSVHQIQITFGLKLRRRNGQTYERNGRDCCKCI